MALLTVDSMKSIEKLVHYLRRNIPSGPLKTAQFVSQATLLLNVTRRQALELSVELNFIGGELSDVSTLFDMNEKEKPLRSLFLNSIHEILKNTRTSNEKINTSTKNILDTEKNTEKFRAVKHLVDALVADIYKISRDCYGLNSSQFVDVALRHEFRRSEAWQLLKPMGFQEGIAVCAREKWFDNREMKGLYWNILADAFTMSFKPKIVAAEKAPLRFQDICSYDEEEEELPGWAGSGLLQQNFKSVKHNQKSTTFSSSSSFTPAPPSPNARLTSSTAPTPSGKSIRMLSTKYTSYSNIEPSSQNESDNEFTDDEYSSSYDSRCSTPDWASSHKWKKRLNITKA